MKPLLRVARRLSWLALLGGGIGFAAESETKLAPSATIDLNARLGRLTLEPSGRYLYWLNHSDGKLQRASLADRKLDPAAATLEPKPRDFAISLDGKTAWVAATPNEYNAYRADAEQRGTIQEVNLATMSAGLPFGIVLDPFEIVADRTGRLYATPGSGQWVAVQVIDPRQRKIVGSFGSISARSNLRITPERHRLYLANNGISPGDISSVTVPASGSNLANVKITDSPYHGEHALGGAFDLTPDARFAVNRHGTVVRVATEPKADMQHAATLEKNLASAADPSGGRLWLATADGRLLTYSYPTFQLQKTERLLAAAGGLAYDAARDALWVAWVSEPGGAGGLDIYDLKNPAAYPNDITKAREKAVAAPKAPPRVLRQQPAAQPASGPKAAEAAGEPDRPRRVASPGNAAAARRDTVILSCLGTCVLLFIGTLFFGRRISPDGDPEDSRNWPVPGSIKFFGGFAWFQVFAIAVVVLLAPFPMGQDEAVVFGRFMAVIGVVLGLLGWGIIRGNKICFVLYALLLLLDVANTLLRGGPGGFLSALLLVIMIYYGKKHWEVLS